MPCTSPRNVGFKSDGTTLSWSPKTHNKEYPLFQLPCGKCIECRLSYARQWAVRCIHEAQMYEKNCFITLTYNDEHLKSPKLDYTDFQKFVKKLRRIQNEPIGIFVTGEYGTINKRPHWHAIVFNWEPADKIHKRTNERRDKIFSSETLDKIWSHGITETGSVTLESAGYCARYAAKKLVHGKDQEHDYQPISKKSSKYAIGKKWLEKFWPDIFSYGQCILSDGTSVPIPRYYEKWLQQQHPEAWVYYVTETKAKRLEKISEKSIEEKRLWLRNLYQRNLNGYRTTPLTPNQVKQKIIEAKFKLLQEHLKL